MRFLSQCIGRPVRDPSGEPIGKVADLIVAIGDRYPPVTGLVVAHRPAPHLPALDDVSHRSTTPARGCDVRTIDIDKFQQRPNEILLKADLLDKQIVDIDGRKVVRVNDLRLDEIEGRLHVVAVDVGAAGLFRRLGLEGPFRTLARNLRATVPERYIDWEDVDPVETSIASIRLRVPARRPRRAPPGRPRRRSSTSSTPRDRAGVLASLDDEAARRRRRGDGARHPGRGPRGPRARSAPPTSSRR